MRLFPYLQQKLRSLKADIKIDFSSPMIEFMGLFSYNGDVAMVNKDAAQMQRKWVREEVVVLVSEYFKSKLLSKDEIKCR